MRFTDWVIVVLLLAGCAVVLAELYLKSAAT